MGGVKHHPYRKLDKEAMNNAGVPWMTKIDRVVEAAPSEVGSLSWHVHPLLIAEAVERLTNSCNTVVRKLLASRTTAGDPAGRRLCGGWSEAVERLARGDARLTGQPLSCR